MEDYKELKEHFEMPIDLITPCQDYFEELSLGTYEMFKVDDGNSDKLLTLVGVMCRFVYSYYQRDKIAYLDKDYFVQRLCEHFVMKIPEYVVKYNINNILSNFELKGDYDTTSKVTSNSKEKASAGSTVVQSTASTPTAVSPNNTGDSLVITKIKPLTGVIQATFENDGYADKYTNFQGKTNGLHDNDVTRDSEIIRKGKLLDIIELSSKLPNNLYADVVRDVSSNFIFLY